MNGLCAAFLTALAMVAGCGPDFANPSGSCGIRSDGGRAGYHATGSDVRWVPDCQNPLLREYWRAFSSDGKTAGLVPRPEGAPELQAPCTDLSHDLHGLVETYELCTAATSPEQVERINHIQLADALRVVHFLHTQLKFVIAPAPGSILPYPIPSDIVAACEIGAQPNSTELEAICQRERDRLRSGSDIGLKYEGAGAVELVARLNTLYGIP